MKVPVWLRWVSRLYILSAAAALLWQWFHYEGLFRAASEAWIEANRLQDEAYYDKMAELVGVDYYR